MQAVPHTDAHFVNPRDPYLLRIDPISHDDIGTLKHPVERGRWIQWRNPTTGAIRRYFRPMPRRQIYDLSNLQRWWQTRAGEDGAFPDPMTNLPVTWQDDFDAVRWTRTPSHLIGKQYTKQTEKAIAAILQPHVVVAPELQRFQEEMQAFWRSEDPTPVRDWVQDYFRMHGDGQTHYDHPGFPEFRRQMAMRLNSAVGQPLEWVRKYWNLHPIDPLQDSDDVVQTYDFFFDPQRPSEDVQMMLEEAEQLLQFMYP